MCPPAASSTRTRRMSCSMSSRSNTGVAATQVLKSVCLPTGKHLASWIAPGVQSNLSSEDVGSRRAKTPSPSRKDAFRLYSAGHIKKEAVDGSGTRVEGCIGAGGFVFFCWNLPSDRWSTGPSEFRHWRLIAFAAWSSFAHALVMSTLGLEIAGQRTGFLAASAVLVVIGVVLIVLAPRKSLGQQTGATAA